MTEAEWMAASNPISMVNFLEGKASGRKSRAFIASACMERRLIFDDYPDDELRRFQNDVAQWIEDGDYEIGGPMFNEFLSLVSTSYRYGLFPLWNRAWKQVQEVAPDAPDIEEKYRTVVRILCIFGNPFRPVAVDPSWLTSDVLALATGIYADRAFDRMPILADALQDAGCENTEILDHCREPGLHVRGCFVVDLLLRKE